MKGCELFPVQNLSLHSVQVFGSSHVGFYRKPVLHLAQKKVGRAGRAGQARSVESLQGFPYCPPIVARGSTGGQGCLSVKVSHFSSHEMLAFDTVLNSKPVS